MKHNERCLLLRDVGNGLMARLANLKATLASPGGRPHTLQNPEWSKITSKLARSFPDQADMSRQVGYQSFQQHAAIILEELSNIYHTFVDILEFNEAAVQELQSLPQDFTEFRLDHNSFLLSNYMELLVAYVQVHLLWSSVDECKVLLSTYSCAHKCVRGSQDPTFSRLASYIMSNVDNPLRNMATEFEQLSPRLGDIVVSLMQPISICLNPATLRQQNVLNPLDDPSSLPLPVDKPLGLGSNLQYHTELLHVDRYIVWAVYVALICPSQLVRGEVLEVLKVAATDCYVVPVHRNMMLNVHQELEALAKWYKPVGAPRGFKLKDEMKKIAQDAASSCGLKHRERRSYLRGELANLKNLFHNIPGLLGPKFPMAMAAISMAQSELVWYFRHLNQEPPRANKKLHVAEHFTDLYISTLATLLNEVVSLARTHSEVIQRYYVEFMKGAHRTAVDRLTQMAIQRGSVFSNAQQDILRSFVVDIDALDADNLQGIDLDPFRLNWARIVAVFTATSTNTLRVDGVEDLILRMNVVVRHSQYVDNLGGELSKCGELSECWWFREHFIGAFRASLQGMSQAQDIMVFLRMISGAALNLHPFCPEEQEPMGEEMVRLARQLMAGLSDRMETLVRDICKMSEKLEQQVKPVEAAYRVQRQQLAKKKQQQQQQQANEPLPGHESNAWCRSVIQGLIELEQSLSHLCSAVSRTKNVVVYNVVFSPIEYIREKFAACLRQYIEDSMRDGENTIERPSVLLRKINHFFFALQRCSSHINIEINKIVRETLFEATYSAAFFTVGKVVEASDASASATARLVNHYTSWYTRFIENLLGAASAGICYVDSRRGFIRVRRQASLCAEMYASQEEFQALATLFGVQGVRTMDSALLKMAQDRAMRVKQIIGENQEALANFRQAFKDPNWSEAVRSMNQLSQLVHHFTAIGITLTMRQMLHDALAEVQRQRIPFIQECVRMAQQQYIENADGQEELMPLDFLADDCGLHLGAVDHSLKSALKSLKVTANDGALWELLPYAFAASLQSDAWKRAQYLTRDDCFQNNEHCMVLALHKLMCCFQSIPSIGINPAESVSIKDMMDALVQSSAVVLLRMKRYETSTYKDFPIRAQLIFLEKFVGASTHMNRSTLEACLPYAILHASYVDMSLNRRTGTDVGFSSSQAFSGEGADEETKG